MNIDEWLAAAVADVQKRGLEDVTPFLTALARLTATLRTTDFETVDAALAARVADRSADLGSRGEY